MSLIESLNSLTSPASTVLSLAATVLMARHSLRRYLTFLQLLPPPPPTPAEIAQSTAKEDVELEVKGWRRLFTKRALKAYRHFALMITIQWGVAFGLPRLANKMFLDIFWTLLPIGLMFFVSGAATLYLYPSLEELSLERKDPKSGLTLKTTELPSKKYEEHLRTAFAATCMTVTMVSAYYGFNLPQALIAGLFTSVVCNIRFPKMRNMIKLFVGLLAAMPVMMLMLVPLVEYLKQSNSPKSEVVMPEKWLMNLGMSSGYGMGMMLPSPILAMTYRYEHTKSFPPPPRTADPVPVVRHLPPFAHPLYSTGLITLAASIFGGDYIVRNFIPSLGLEDMGLGMFASVVCTPIVILAIAVRAWTRSELNDWWMYEESWIPNKAEAQAILADHAEKGAEKKGFSFSDDADVVEGLM